MANIKSAKKRVVTSQLRADRNKAIKSRVKTFVKKVDAAVEAKDKAAAEAALPVAIAEISKAASKGIFHKNTAARKVILHVIRNILKNKGEQRNEHSKKDFKRIDQYSNEHLSSVIY